MQIFKKALIIEQDKKMNIAYFFKKDFFHHIHLTKILFCRYTHTHKQIAI